MATSGPETISGCSRKTSLFILYRREFSKLAAFLQTGLKMNVPRIITLVEVNIFKRGDSAGKAPDDLINSIKLRAMSAIPYDEHIIEASIMKEEMSKVHSDPSYENMTEFHPLTFCSVKESAKRDGKLRHSDFNDDPGYGGCPVKPATTDVVTPFVDIPRKKLSNNSGIVRRDKIIKAAKLVGRNRDMNPKDKHNSATIKFSEEKRRDVNEFVSLAQVDKAKNLRTSDQAFLSRILEVEGFDTKSFSESAVTFLFGKLAICGFTETFKFKNPLTELLKADNVQKSYISDVEASCRKLLPYFAKQARPIYLRELWSFQYGKGGCNLSSDNFLRCIVAFFCGLRIEEAAALSARVESGALHCRIVRDNAGKRLMVNFTKGSQKSALYDEIGANCICSSCDSKKHPFCWCNLEDEIASLRVNSSFNAQLTKGNFERKFHGFRVGSSNTLLTAGVEVENVIKLLRWQNICCANRYARRIFTFPPSEEEIINFTMFRCSKEKGLSYLSNDEFSVVKHNNDKNINDKDDMDSEWSTDDEHNDNILGRRRKRLRSSRLSVDDEGY